MGAVFPFLDPEILDIGRMCQVAYRNGCDVHEVAIIGWAVAALVTGKDYRIDLGALTEEEHADVICLLDDLYLRGRLAIDEFCPGVEKIIQFSALA